MKTQIELKDCVEGMKELSDRSVDLVVTSPPYNLGIAYGAYKDGADRKTYLAWTCQWAAQVKRVLHGDGSFCLNVGASPANPFLPHEMVLELRELLALQNTFHWIKSISIDRDTGVVSAGHFKPINSRRFITDCHEYVFHLTHTGNVPLDRLAVGVPYTDKSNVARWKHTDGRDLRCRGNNWFIPYETIQCRDKERAHPATFPRKLAEYCIRIHGRRDDLVMMDPFLGIGNAALAALDCGVATFIGFDIDPGYIDEAKQRLREAEAAVEVKPTHEIRSDNPGVLTTE